MVEGWSLSVHLLLQLRRVSVCKTVSYNSCGRGFNIWIHLFPSLLDLSPSHTHKHTEHVLGFFLCMEITEMRETMKP